MCQLASLQTPQKKRLAGFTWSLQRSLPLAHLRREEEAAPEPKAQASQSGRQARSTGELVGTPPTFGWPPRWFFLFWRVKMKGFSLNTRKLAFKNQYPEFLADLGNGFWGRVSNFLHPLDVFLERPDLQRLFALYIMGCSKQITLETTAFPPYWFTNSWAVTGFSWVCEKAMWLRFPSFPISTVPIRSWVNTQVPCWTPTVAPAVLPAVWRRTPSHLLGRPRWPNQRRVAPDFSELCVWGPLDWKA